MPETTPDKLNPDGSTWLTHQWVVAGIVSSAARFIPIPFVDDVIRSRCRQFVVSRTLAAHQRTDLLDDLKPFFDSSGGCLNGCVATAVKAPLKLLLFPVRKFVAIVTSIRGVPLEIMRMVLLGRTLDRHLRDESATIDPTQSARMRLAFEESFARIDFRVVRAAMTDALTSVKGWKSAAIATARGLADSGTGADEAIEPEPKIDAGAANIQQVLDRPETLDLFAEFDRRFDEALKRIG
ncbi:hypothetical protein [Rubripirellula reticaptiva]|uniref:Uncharacterized protein n=1 Tax=Rubripirellula reticaptiva TaxID=2528013 RepID=A0A5C6FF88_9BACT|nr:hypothetical protein [Rubripirellula reticaptiva]TWU58251.1 hypothetical protein Poly59_11620 [Rubripirellula reticaptiva]